MAFPYPHFQRWKEGLVRKSQIPLALIMISGFIAPPPPQLYLQCPWWGRGGGGGLVPGLHRTPKSIFKDAQVPYIK